MTIPWYVKLIGVFVVLGAIAGGLYALYSWGEATGNATGDKAGYTRAWNAQQEQVNKLTGQINTEHEQHNKQVAQLETKAEVLQAQNEKLMAQNAKRVTDVVTEYVKNNPATANTCGLDLPAVQAIRDAMQATAAKSVQTIGAAK